MQARPAIMLAMDTPEVAKAFCQLLRLINDNEAADVNKCPREYFATRATITVPIPPKTIRIARDSSFDLAEATLVRPAEAAHKNDTTTPA